MISSYDGHTPVVPDSVFVQASAHIIGNVALGDESSVWFGAVLRGDVHSIRIGRRTNLQDHAVVHVSGGRWPTIVGDEVTVGHAAVLHGCMVADRCLIGIGAIVLDGAIIEEDAMVGAGAVVTPGSVIRSGFLALGQPAKAVRPLRDEEREHVRQSAANYVQYAQSYRRQGIA